MYELLFVLVGGVVYAYVARWWRRRKLSQATQWPTVQGYIAAIEEQFEQESIGRHGNILRVTLVYTYKVADERYDGRETFKFASEDLAGQFTAACRKRSVLIHYRPDKPSVSRIARQPSIAGPRGSANL